MASLLAFLRDKSNRDLLSWVGAGLATIAAVVWTVVVYLGPADTKSPSPAAEKAQVRANCGGIAVGGGVANSIITTGGAQTKC